MKKITLNQKTNSAIAHILNNTIYNSMEELKSTKRIKIHSRGRIQVVRFLFQLRNEVIFSVNGKGSWCFKVEEFKF